MATEKAIVNTSTSVISLTTGRLLPGGVLRVLDHFPDEATAFSDLVIRKCVTTGHLQIQDVDFDALARAKVQNGIDAVAEVARQARLAQAELDRREAARTERARALLIEEGRALERAEAVAAAPPALAKPDDPDDDLLALYESTRKQRIAKIVEERAASAQSAVQEAAQEPAQVDEQETTHIPAQSTEQEPEQIVVSKDVSKSERMGRRNR